MVSPQLGDHTRQRALPFLIGGGGGVSSYVALQERTVSLVISEATTWELITGA